MSVKDIITIIFSSTLITTVITTIFNLFTNKKKDAIENITKERKSWRDELRRISLRIYKSKNLKELKIAVSELKVRSNAYGIASNTIFKDVFIWESINKLESTNCMSKKDFENTKREFVDLISCNLKYDWERSKAEIKGNTQTKIVAICLLISFVLYSVRWFYYYSIGVGIISNYLSFCTMYILIVCCAILLITLADKWKNRFQLYSHVLAVFSIPILIYVLLHNLVPSSDPYNWIDYIVLGAPYLALIYASETKALLYRRDMQDYIRALTIATGKKTIDRKYKAFFFFRRYKNEVTGYEIIIPKNCFVSCISSKVKNRLKSFKSFRRFINFSKKVLVKLICCFCDFSNCDFQNNEKTR